MTPARDQSLQEQPRRPGIFSRIIHSFCGLRPVKRGRKRHTVSVPGYVHRHLNFEQFFESSSRDSSIEIKKRPKSVSKALLELNISFTDPPRIMRSQSAACSLPECINSDTLSIKPKHANALRIAVMAGFTEKEREFRSQLRLIDLLSRSRSKVKSVQGRVAESLGLVFDPYNIFEDWDVDTVPTSQTAIVSRSVHGAGASRPLETTQYFSRHPETPPSLPTWPKPEYESQLLGFGLMMELPQDVRLLIWDRSIWTAPRVYQIRISPPDEVRLRYDFPTAALRVCKESRDEAFRQYGIMTRISTPREMVWDCPSYRRILNPIELPFFNCESDTVAVSLLDFVPNPDEYDKRQLFSKVVQDNGVRYLHLNDVFVSSSVFRESCVLEDLFPPYLLHNSLRGLRIRFFVRNLDLSDPELPTARIHMGSVWVPASDTHLSNLLQLTRNLVERYCKEKKRSHVPYVETF